MTVAAIRQEVHAEEMPSSVPAITGVATSVAAFIGWAPVGPVDRAQLVLSWSDYERKFGGLDRRSYLGYAVWQFFLNGGQFAYVVRLTNNAIPASVKLEDILNITAKNPGAWSNDYAIVIKRHLADDSDKSERFQLKIVCVKEDGRGVPVEIFENLSMKSTDSRYVVNVLNANSNYINAEAIGTPTESPSSTVLGQNGEIPIASRLQNGSDGRILKPNDPAFENALLPNNEMGGVYLLEYVDIFNLLCVPGETNPSALSRLQEFCKARRAFLIVDSPADFTFQDFGKNVISELTGPDSINSAYYFPWVLAPDPLQANCPSEFPPCGFVAGLYARTDATKGVWGAPAGTEAGLVGIAGLKTNLTNDQNGFLNPKAVNCILDLPLYGPVLWGARTLRGGDENGPLWKYIPVRRTALFIEESLNRALKWLVFEQNGEALWSQIRFKVSVFMNELYCQGAFKGQTPEEAFFVKCNKETTTQDDINWGIVNILIGFAPLKPAEFVLLHIQQFTGHVQT